MNSYVARNLPWGKLAINFHSQRRDDVAPHDFGNSHFIDISQQRDLRTRNADWWLQVSSLTSLMDGGFVHQESDITLRLSNGIYGILLSGEDEDFRLLAEQLKLVFPRLDELVMKLRVPASVDLGPFFRALQAQSLRFKFTCAAAGQHVVSLLESIVLNQTAREVDIDNKISALELSQLKLLGERGTPVERNTALVWLSLDLELHKQDDAPAAADRLAKYLRRFRNLKYIEISGKLDVSFMVPFFKALKDGNNQTSNDPGLAAECFVIDFHDVYVEEDFCDKENCIPHECVELVLDCIRHWKGGFLWIGLGQTHRRWNTNSESRAKLRYKAAFKWLTEAPHLDNETASRGSALAPEKISAKDIYNVWEREQQQRFPPVNFYRLFPGQLPVDMPFDTQYMSSDCFVFQMLFDLVVRNPTMLIATVASVLLPSNPRKRSCSEDLSDGHAPQHE